MIARPTNIYPCNGRERTTKAHIAQDGYHEFMEGGRLVRGAPRWIEVKTEFFPDCQFDRSGKDPKCSGCGHRKTTE
jgi:hypothetical protein